MSEAEVREWLSGVAERGAGHHRHLAADALAELNSRGTAIERVRDLIARRRADDDGRGPAPVSVAELLRALDGEPR